MKTATLIAAIIAATITPSLARETVIVRRSPACLQQQDLSEFYNWRVKIPAWRSCRIFSAIISARH